MPADPPDPVRRGIAPRAMIGVRADRDLAEQTDT
jgi:hypothetical protein